MLGVKGKAIIDEQFRRFRRDRIVIREFAPSGVPEEVIEHAKDEVALRVFCNYTMYVARRN